MSVTLDELLALVGRLDDAPGFDTPRERFRRFLLERVTDAEAARSFVDECQRSVGEQRHRALEDLIALVGRMLGFEIAFGTYQRAQGDLAALGRWRSPGLLSVVLEIRTEQTTDATLDDFAQAIAGSTDADPRIGLCVVARQYAARGRLIRAIATDERRRDIRVISVQSLLSLAVLVTGNRLTHAEVVKLLQSGFELDFAINLLDRPASSGQPDETALETVHVTPAVQDDRDHRDARDNRAFWFAIITGNDAESVERLFHFVIAGRRVLPIRHAGRLRNEGTPGDWVCFFLPGKGVVGHAQLASIVEETAGVIRHASRFTRVYRLGDVAIYEEFTVPAAPRERRFTMLPMRIEEGASLLPIAKPDFLSLTTYQDDGARVDHRQSGIA